MKSNTGKQRFLRDAIEYIKNNGPSTAGVLHEELRYTKKGKLLRDSPSRRQAQQLLARSNLFTSRDVMVTRVDVSLNTPYMVKEYSLVGDE